MCNSCNKCKPSDTKVCNISASQVMDPLKYSFANTKDLLGVTRILLSFSRVYSVTINSKVSEMRLAAVLRLAFSTFLQALSPFKPLQLLDCDKIVRSSGASNSYVRFVILFYATAF